jgi:hypothetical protein
MWLAGDAFADIVIAFTMTHLVRTALAPRILTMILVDLTNFQLANAPEKETKHMVRRVVRLVIETNTFTGKCVTPPRVSDTFNILFRTPKLPSRSWALSSSPGSPYVAS